MSNKKNISIILSIYFTVVCIAAYEILHGKLGGAYTLSDWLTNYSGGFVRRGLAGEILLSLSTELFNPGLLAVLLIILLYIAFLYFCYKILVQEKQLTAYLPLLLSPALFLFPINDFSALGRKELIFFVIIAFIVWRELNGKNAFYNFIYIVVYPLTILTHEVLILTLPFIFFIQQRNTPDHLQKHLKVTCLAFPSLIALGFCLYFKQGDYEAIYAAIIERGYALKVEEDNAITALTRDIWYYLDATIKHPGLSFRFTPYLLLSTIGFYFIRTKFYKLSPFSYALLIGPLVGFIVVSIIAIDYGRWINIYVMALFLISFLNKTYVANIQWTKIKLCFLLVYSLSWALPVYYGNIGLPVVIKLPLFLLKSL